VFEGGQPLVDIFVYGTLLDNGLVVQLTGRRFPRCAAQLRGYRKHTPAGSYPYVVPDDNGVVEGVVLREIDSEALRALDEYEDEGQLYRRIEVTITVAGWPQRAFVYASAK